MSTKKAKGTKRKDVKKIARDVLLFLSGLKYSFFLRRKNIKKTPLKIYWWNGAGGRNFGDVITPDIVKSLFGYSAEWAPINDCELIGAGSLLGFAEGRDYYVWGSGFIDDKGAVNDNLNYLAVRGKISRARINRKWRNISLGDPGLLANLVYPAAKTKVHQIGVVAHYVDKTHAVIKKMQADDRFVIIDVFDPPALIARKISSCELILSSSLHGLIFADSFRVPNIHLQLSDQVTGGDYKFRDYYSGINKDYQNADVSKIFDDAYLENIRKSYRPIKNLRQIQRDLIKTFPY